MTYICSQFFLDRNIDNCITYTILKDTGFQILVFLKPIVSGFIHFLGGIR